MDKKEIAEILRNEVGELEACIVKLQNRCERLKTFVLDLEEEITGPETKKVRPFESAKFRKMVDQVFGEKPKRSGR